MTTRLVQTSDVLTVIERFDVALSQAAFQPRPLITPSYPLPVVFKDGDGKRRLRLMRWGVVLRWNAQAQSQALPTIRWESLTEKRHFQPFLRTHRCLVPADGFLTGNAPNGLQRWRQSDPSLFGIAAIVNAAPLADGTFQLAVGIVTREAAGHIRVPILVPPSEEARWLDNQEASTPALISAVANYVAPLQSEPISSSELYRQEAAWSRQSAA